MTDQLPPAIPGYLRIGVTHTNTMWRFEILSEELELALATIETDDGPFEASLNRVAAERLFEQLQLFLSKWPKGSAYS